MHIIIILWYTVYMYYVLVCVQVLIDTRTVQKEINQLTGKLDRQFTVTDELIFRVYTVYTHIADISHRDVAIFNVFCVLFCMCCVLLTDFLYRPFCHGVFNLTLSALPAIVFLWTTIYIDIKVAGSKFGSNARA